MVPKKWYGNIMLGLFSHLFQMRLVTRSATVHARFGLPVKLEKLLQCSKRGLDLCNIILNK